jgi:hypothetical protein
MQSNLLNLVYLTRLLLAHRSSRFIESALTPSSPCAGKGQEACLDLGAGDYFRERRSRPVQRAHARQRDRLHDPATFSTSLHAYRLYFATRARCRSIYFRALSGSHGRVLLLAHTPLHCELLY